MNGEDEYRVELLDPAKHRRETFQCESQALNEYLQQRARKEMAARTSVCFVLVPVASPDRIAGYYTLSAASISVSKLPPELARRLPRYPEVPAVLLGRLARDLTFRGKGIGDRLLSSALWRIHRTSSEIGAVVVVTDAKEENAVRFYQSFGFRILEGKRLFFPVVEIPQQLQRGEF